MNTNKSKRIRAAVTIVIAAFSFTTVVFLLFPTVFQSWESQTIDRLFVLREHIRPSPYDTAIVHIDIDNSSIKRLSYYFPRRFHATVIDAARRMGLAAVAYDIIFAAPVNSADDTLLLDAVHRSGGTYFPVAFELNDGAALPRLEIDEGKYLDSTAWTLPGAQAEKFYHTGSTLVTWPGLSSRSHGVGFISVSPDADGVYRRVPLVVRYKNSFYPSLVFRLACDLLQVTPENILIDGGHAITLRNAVSRSGTRRDIVIPIDDQGNLIINWIGPWDRMTHLSFASLLAAADDRDELEALGERYAGAIGIVGDVATGMSDVGPIPFERAFPLVGLHANVLNSLLTENFLRPLTIPEVLAIELILAILMVVFSYAMSSSVYPLSTLGLVVAYGILSCAAFIYWNVIGVFIHPVMSVIVSTGSVLTYRYVIEEREKAQLRIRFESYFPPAVIRQMMDNPEMRIGKPKNTVVTIMFSDIKSFTTYSSTMSPETISESLSEYFEAMTEIVFKYEGTVDKFLGDGLMVFYGAPEEQADHAERCVKAAIEMQLKCGELKKEWIATGRFPLDIRIGINTGEVTVGDLGSERRKEYTVIGSPVNLTQRLESNAPVGGILISATTHALIKDVIPTRALAPILVKGLTTPIVVYEVVLD